MENNSETKNEQRQFKSEVKNLNFYYGGFNALKNIDMVLHDKKITALIGPSGCGKATFYVVLIECTICIREIGMKVRLYFTQMM